MLILGFNLICYGYDEYRRASFEEGYFDHAIKEARQQQAKS